MSITPTSNLFTAISLADLAKPVQRPVQHPGQSQPRKVSDDQGQVAEGRQGQPQRRAIGDGQTFKQAVKSDDPDHDGDQHDGKSVAADFRREAVGPQRPRFQKLGQLVDLSV